MSQRLSELPDAALAALTRQAEADLPDAPAWLVESALALWRPPAAEPPALMRRLVAALRFDSWAVAPTLAFRSAQPAAARQLLFSAGERDVDLRLNSGPPAPAGGLAAGHSMAGQVLGPGDGGEVVLQRGEATLASTPLDDFGEFRFDGLAAGLYALVLRFGDDSVVLPDIELGGDPG